MNIFGGDTPTDVEINFVEHDGQEEVLRAMVENWKLPPEQQAAIIEVIASRGWGKTLFMAAKILTPFCVRSPSAKVMWVAPSYNTAMSPIEDVFRGTDEITGKRWIPQFDESGAKIWEFAVTQSGPMLKFFNGATVSFKSAESPESIVSRGFNLIIIDEAALIEERVFLQQIMGTARKRGIKIFIITSPRGKRHWTYRYYLKGQDGKDTQYLSFQQPFWKNKYFNKTLESLMKDLPDWIIRQEYHAEFIDDGDSIFRNLEAITVGAEVKFDTQEQEWKIPVQDSEEIDTPDGKQRIKASSRRYSFGLDLAKSQDYTVLWGMCTDTGQPVYYKRINKTDYRVIVEMVVDVCRQYNNAEVMFDATGVGSGIADFFNNYDIVAHPFVFTNESKNDLVTELALAFQYKTMHIPNIATILSEFGAFTYTLTRTGKISYGAPAGFHDDIVMAAGLANLHRKENSSTLEASVVENFLALNGEDKDEDFYTYMANDND